MKVGEGRKRVCEDGLSCKYRNEYQHNLEFSHGPSVNASTTNRSSYSSSSSSSLSSSSSYHKWGIGRKLGSGNVCKDTAILAGVDFFNTFEGGSECAHI